MLHSLIRALMVNKVLYTLKFFFPFVVVVVVVEEEEDFNPTKPNCKIYCYLVAAHLRDDPRLL